MSTSSPSTSSTLIDRRDISFLLDEWLDVEKMLERPRYAGQSRDVFDDVIDLSQRIATDLFAPHNREADENEPHVGPDGKVELIDAIGPALDAFSPQERQLFLQVLAQGSLAPPTSSLGRLLDGLVSLLGLAQTLSYEGEGGLRLQGAAARGRAQLEALGVSEEIWPFPLRACQAMSTP